MRRISGQTAGGALALCLIASTSAAGAPSGSGATGAPPIVLPALPDATVNLPPAPAAPVPSSVRPPPAAAAVLLSGPGSSGSPAQAEPKEPAPAAASATPRANPPPPLKAALDQLWGPDGAAARVTASVRRRREAIAAFYAARAYAPLWLAKGAWTPAARAVAARLEQADGDGLNAAALHVPALGSGDARALDATELALTESLALYGEQASGGRVDPRAVSHLIADPHTQLSPAGILDAVASSNDPARTLDGFNPPQAGYQALRAQLARLRAQGPAASEPRIPSGRSLRVGMRDARATLLRARLALAPANGSERLVYDQRLAAAVAQFQKSAGLDATGVLTPRTVAALNGGRNNAALESDLIANMELWRWMPRTMGGDRIEVNIPDFMLTLYQGQEAALRARVVVGKATTPTPIFSNAVRFVVVNPSWIVPQSIVRKEMLPKLATDPNYFQQMGYVVTRRGDALEVKQPPGDRNALGRIKFLFPNDYDVYLHDTPERALFNASRRAFSHGCVRVQHPFVLGQDVLGVANGWSKARLKRLIGDRERTIRVARPLPVYMEYFTAFVDPDGRLEQREDVYGYVRKIEAALRLPH